MYTCIGVLFENDNCCFPKVLCCPHQPLKLLHGTFPNQKITPFLHRCFYGYFLLSLSLSLILSPLSLWTHQEQRSQLLLWLGFIKTRNLGQKPFVDSPTEQDSVPMATDQKPRRRLLTARLMQKPQVVVASDTSIPEQNGTETAGKGSGGEEEAGKRKDELEGSEEARGAEENLAEGAGDPKNQNGSQKPVEMYGSYIEPVPVVIVGSHYDKLEGQAATEAVQQAQQLVDELREQFEEYLTISPRLYPLNCLSAVSKEIKDLKERLCEVRSELVEVI